MPQLTDIRAWPLTTAVANAQRGLVRRSAKLLKPGTASVGWESRPDCWRVPLRGQRLVCSDGPTVRSWPTPVNWVAAFGGMLRDRILSSSLLGFRAFRLSHPTVERTGLSATPNCPASKTRLPRRSRLDHALHPARNAASDRAAPRRAFALALRSCARHGGDWSRSHPASGRVP